MTTRILALNAGSSSLKFALFTAERGEARALARGQVAGLPDRPRLALSAVDGDLPIEAREASDALPAVLEALGVVAGSAGEPEIVAHRLVHGGARFTAPIMVDDAIFTVLETLSPLAPLHMPYGLRLLREARAAVPRARHLACFDTAFHATQPAAAFTLPLPERLRTKGYRRYGFHGLSFESAVAALARETGALPSRVVALHLGAGASACAILDGRSVATTMGYSPLDGLVMSTRTGALDPGVVLALLRDEGMSLGEVETALWRDSGLKGLSGGESDMRRLLEREDAAARRAVESFVRAACYHVAGLTAMLGGLDALIFTGGVGENAAAIRAAICRGLAVVGAAIDDGANDRHATLLSSPGALPSIWRFVADEEQVLAVQAATRLGDAS